MIGVSEPLQLHNLLLEAARSVVVVIPTPLRAVRPARIKGLSLKGESRGGVVDHFFPSPGAEVSVRRDSIGRRDGDIINMLVL